MTSVPEEAEPLDRLAALFDLEELEVDLYRADNPADWPGGRVFGGLVAGQALRAATATVQPAHRVHSLHAYFLRPGETGVPIVYAVDRVRDGRSFSTRGVAARQHGETIFTVTASYHASEDGPDYQLPIAADAPGPEDLGPAHGRTLSRMWSMDYLDIRDAGPTPRETDGSYRSTRRMWIRTARRLPDDPGLHAAIVAFVSDMGLVSAVHVPVATEGQRFMGASLDHALWFHRPARADEWLYYDMSPLSNAGARGLARGLMHTRDGVLVASVAQEALVRPLG